MAWLLNLLNTDWFLGFLSGVGATLLGFTLTIIWDVRKAGNERREREKAIMNAINEELITNKKNVEFDHGALLQELVVLAENKFNVQPLSLMKIGFWELAKVNMPTKLLGNDKLARLRNLVFLAEQVNDQIRSRENYRIHNETKSNFSGRMRLYDERLVSILLALAQEILAYEKDGAKK